MKTQDLIDKFSEIGQLAGLIKGKANEILARDIQQVCEQVLLDYKAEQKHPLPKIDLEFAKRLDKISFQVTSKTEMQWLRVIAERIRRHHGQMD